jgi:hypothetical protein
MDRSLTAFNLFVVATVGNNMPLPENALFDRFF